MKSHSVSPAGKASPGDKDSGTLERMDWLVKPGGYLYVDVRNWDRIVAEKQQYYFSRPIFHGDLRPIEKSDWYCILAKKRRNLRSGLL